MKIDIYNKILLDAAKERIPEGINLANYLMDILFIGKEAVYRRLRGEVPFTLLEAGIISKNLGISLDILVGNNTEKSKPFQMKLVEYADPTEIDYAMLQNYVDILQLGKDDPYSELITSANVFPQSFYMKFDYLSKFFLFKWTYHNEKKQIKAYHEIETQDRLKKIMKDSVASHMQINTTCYIFDKYISQYLVNDIKYFAGIRLINNEDLQLIKKDFHNMLNYMEDIATTAKFETGTDIYIYVSNINFENSYTNVKILNYRISLIEAFILNGAASLDEDIYEKVNAWILSLRRLSTLISQSGELQRIDFFKEQRKIVDTL